MNRLTFMFCIAMLFCGRLFSQSLDYSGPVSTSMAFVKVFDDSPWAGLANTSNLAMLKGFSVGASYQMRFNMDELSARAASLALPTRLGTFGGLVFQNGYSKSSYSRYGFSYSRLFGKKVSAGLQFNYLSHQIEGADRAGAFYSSLGLNFLISANWGVGVFIQNPEQASINYQVSDFALPTFFNTAVRWSPSAHFLLVIELEKQLEYEMVYKTGLQFNFKERLFVRGGVKGKPVELTFGGGFHLGGLSIDVGFAHHQQLGMTSGAGLSYSFHRKKN